MKCSDCGYPTDRMKPETVAKGSSIREPGEALCGGCASRRIIMVRQLDALPTDLSVIRAKRQAVG